jgi:hypothetical protein
MSEVQRDLCDHLKQVVEQHNNNVLAIAHLMRILSSNDDLEKGWLNVRFPGEFDAVKTAFDGLPDSNVWLRGILAFAGMTGCY